MAVNCSDCPWSRVYVDGEIETEGAESTVNVADDEVAVAEGDAPDVTPVSVNITL